MSSPRSSDPSKPLGRKSRWRLFFGGVLAGGVLALALLFIPAVQGWIVKRYIAAQPGWRLDFARFFAGPTGVELDNVDFSMPGIEARTEPVRVQIAPTQLLRSRQLRIEKVEAKKVRLIITPEKFVTPSPTPGTPFAGLLPLLQMPMAWAVDRAELDGQIVLNEGGTSLVVGDFKILGGGLAPEQRGDFAYEVSFNSTLLPIASSNHVRSRGTIHLTQTAAHGIARIELAGELQLPAYGGLTLPTGKIQLAIEHAAGGENYRALLDFGEAGHFSFTGEIAAASTQLLAKLEWTARDALFASAVHSPLPALHTTGSADLALDLESTNFTAALQGQFTGRDWQKYLAELAPVPEFAGTWQAALTRAGAQLKLERFTLLARAQDAPTEIELGLNAPVDLLALPATPLATFDVHALPVAWANPWLADSGVTVGGANFAGRWSVAVDKNFTAHLQSLGDARASGIKVTGLPLTPVDVAFPSTATLNAESFGLQTPALHIGTTAGDLLEGELQLNYAIGPETTAIDTHLRGRLPTIFGPLANSPALDLATRCTQQGDQVQLEALQLALGSSGAKPSFTVTLHQPLTLDLNTGWPVHIPTAPTDLLQVAGHDFALDWLNHWLTGVSLTGAIVSGHSTLSSTAEGALRLSTPTPWQTSTLQLRAGDQPPWPVALTAQPAATLSLNEKKIQASLALGADLPDLPHSSGTFGPLHVDLLISGQNHHPTMGIFDALDLRVTQTANARELFSLRAEEPFIAGVSQRHTVVLSTVAPFRLKLAELPLAWLQPWLEGPQLSGWLGPAEFLLDSQVTRVQVRPTRPLILRDLQLNQDGRDLLHAANLALYPGLDLTLICTVEPKFQLGFEGLARADNVGLHLAQSPALDLDLALRFLGDTTTVLPAGIELISRARFAAWHQLPWLAAAGLPASGTVVTRINGDLLGKDPIEMWTRVSGVLPTNGDGPLPPLEISAHGQVDGTKRSFTGDVQIALDTQPQRSDAAFQATLDLREANLHIASALTSRYLDVNALMAWADAFTAEAATTPALAKAASTEAVATTSIGGPVWSVLRGSFDLDIGAVEFAPYHIDHVTGRLTLDETNAVVSNLHGEMFAGEWTGGARLDFVRDDPRGDHHLSGEFNIAQFQSARVVQTVFPDNDLAALDALIDVRATVSSIGNRLPELLNQAEARFEIDGSQGTVRLKVPKQNLVATAAVFGGTILLSPELRALGRLLRKFAEMPVDTLRITGTRNRHGEITLDAFRFESPQARLLGRGQIAADQAAPLMQRPLMLSLDLSAKDETAVILGGMKLLRKEADAEGFRALKNPLVLRGPAGEPDTQPLYDLLARAVSGSKGTWGFLMRKVQAEVLKTHPAAPRKTAATSP